MYGMVFLVKEQELRSRGAALYMQTFDFLFGSLLGETILRKCDNLRKTLQKENFTATEGNKMEQPEQSTAEREFHCR